MMKFGEARRAHEGVEGGSFYAEDLVLAKEEKWRDSTYPKVIRASEMVWEDTPHGRIKHVAHPKMNSRVKDIDAYIQEIPPDSRTGKHRHMAEEFMFILQGQGYSLHWDVELVMGDEFGWKPASAPERYDWEAGDWVYVPVNTIHQHFNTDSKGPARFISATSRLYKWLGWHDLEQIEEAPR
jgi:gentisate 1,2-dioxygenase